MPKSLKIAIFELDFFIVFDGSEESSMVLITNPNLLYQNTKSECRYSIIWYLKLPGKVGSWKISNFCSAACSWIPKPWSTLEFAPDFKDGLVLVRKRAILPKNKKMWISIFFYFRWPKSSKWCNLDMNYVNILCVDLNRIL